MQGSDTREQLRQVYQQDDPGRADGNASAEVHRMTAVLHYL